MLKNNFKEAEMSSLIEFYTNENVVKLKELETNSFEFFGFIIGV